jgi:release factor glutamine methyltransferase
MPTPDALSSPRASTLQVALRQAAAELRAAGIEDAGGDARRLAEGVLGMTAAQVLSHPERPLSAQEADRLGRGIARRRAREPVSRILGERDFYGRTFAIGPATLDPRPDSETLITAALELMREEGRLDAPLRILDVGTGSGCLLLTLLCELPGASGVGTDISPAAIDVARENARRLGLAQRSQWLTADVLDGIVGPFDILVSNPPYVRAGDISGLDPEVRLFDPRAALDGGDDGLRIFRRLATNAADVVADGWIVLEVSHDQAADVAELMRIGVRVRDSGDIRYYRDVAGWTRCVAARVRN